MSLKTKLSKKQEQDTFTGEQLVYYIYAVLYSNKYREKYNDQLKYDFPSVPYPASFDYFVGLATIEKKLFDMHLPDTYYRVDAPVVIDKLISYKFKGDTVVLNDSYVIQAVEGIGEKQMGGYKPADKWLKDRKGSELTESDIQIYKSIIQTIIDTESLMRQIDNNIIL